MRLLKDNAILLAKTERGDFFAIYDPSEKDPESRDRVDFGDSDSENASWIKFAFESQAEDAEDGSAKKRILLRAAKLIGEVSERLDKQMEASGG